MDGVIRALQRMFDERPESAQALIDTLIHPPHNGSIEIKFRNSRLQVCDRREIR